MPSKSSNSNQFQESTETRRVHIGVSVRSDLWRELRALAIRKDRNTGELLDEAIADFLKKEDKIF